MSAFSVNRQLYGRGLRILRILAYFPVFYFLWEGYLKLAAVNISVILIGAWYLSFRIRQQDVEKPYYQLWLSFIEGLFAFAVMFWIFIRDSLSENGPDKMLAVGCVLLLARVVTRTLYLLSMLREGMRFFKSGFWSRAATLSINATMLIYVLEYKTLVIKIGIFNAISP
jgi:hypothetical protein